MFVPRYDEQSARDAVASSLSYSEAMRKVGLRPAGGNHKHFRKYVDEIWKISTAHFDPAYAATHALTSARKMVPLEEVLVERSSYPRRSLKKRLYDVGLKPRSCERCGQGEIWLGDRISLILDHINGVPDDNRIENLRILCPNCNATLETHCGRKNQLIPPMRNCLVCGQEFKPKYLAHKHCSRECGSQHANRHRRPRPQSRKVERPSYGRLSIERSQMSTVKVGAKYGVSDNAVRKWLRWYEADILKQVGEALAAGEPREIRV
jgi:hypothetical protein